MLHFFFENLTFSEEICYIYSQNRIAFCSILNSFIHLWKVANVLFFFSFKNIFPSILAKICALQPKSQKPSLHESQLPVERSATLVSHIVVERRSSAAASLDYNGRS